MRLVKESNEIFVRILKLVIVKSLYKDFTFVGVNYVSKVKKKTREMRSQPYGQIERDWIGNFGLMFQKKIISKCNSFLNLRRIAVSVALIRSVFYR